MARPGYISASMAGEVLHMSNELLATFVRHTSWRHGQLFINQRPRAA